MLATLSRSLIKPLLISKVHAYLGGDILDISVTSGTWQYEEVEPRCQLHLVPI